MNKSLLLFTPEVESTKVKNMFRRAYWSSEMLTGEATQSEGNSYKTDSYKSTVDSL